jgi:ketosteroid isomerase-like protein
MVGFFGAKWGWKSPAPSHFGVPQRASGAPFPPPDRLPARDTPWTVSGNEETVRAVTAAFSRGDWDAALSYATPDFRFDTSRDLNETRGVYEGPEAARMALERFFEPWGSWRNEVNEFLYVGEDLVVTRQTGYLRGRDGIEVTARTYGVWTFRDGAVSAFTHFTERRDALEAAGLEE